jgi:hypothetical protein
MLPRRSFVLAGGSLALSGGLVVLGCKRAPSTPSSCEDTKGLTEDERTVRTTLAYVDRTPLAEKACKACQHWVLPAEDGACGGCKLLKGPIHPDGTCKAFAVKG